jgi:hypothetical protein
MFCRAQLYESDLIERMKRTESDSEVNAGAKQEPSSGSTDLKEFFWSAYFSVA